MKGILNNVCGLVFNILVENERARDSDDVLYKCVIYRIAQQEGWLKKLLHYNIGWFFENRAAFGLPPFESVRRSRQKIQAMHPELASTKAVEKMRQMNEEEYRAFAKGE